MNEKVPAASAADRGAMLVALLAIAASGALVATSLGQVQYGTGVDEGHYLVYAKLFQQNGLAGFPELFRDYVADPQRWRYPNPLRVSFIVAAGLWSEVFDARFDALSWLSLTAHLLAVGFSYFYARRLLGNPRALFATLLLAFSPLWLGLARRAMVDSFSTCFAVLSIWTFLDALREGRKGPLVAFGLAFACAALAKETNGLLAIPFALVLLLDFARHREIAVAARQGGVLLASLALTGAVWLVAAGDPGVLLRLVEIILHSPETNPYANEFGGGPWYRYLIDFLLLSPVPTLLGLGSVLWVAIAARRGEAELSLAYLAVIAACLLFEYDFFTKNLRYVAVLDLPLRVLAAAALWELFRGRGSRRPAPAARGLSLALPACGLAVALLAWLDVRSFDLVFVRSGLYDPVSAALLAIRGLTAP